MKRASLKKSLLLGLVIIIGLLIYAYGFDVTQVDLTQVNDPQRQTSLTRVLRAVANPNIFAYEQEEVRVETQVMVPCPPGGFEPPAPDTSGPYLVVTPACAESNEKIVVEGYNFAPETTGPLSFIPANNVNNVALSMGILETDPAGYFRMEVPMRNRPTGEVQLIRAITRTNVGSPYFTSIARETWDKIIETVFMALLATTIGTALAIPVSFFAARNLMKDVSSPLGGLALTIISWPLGIWLGMQLAGLVRRLTLPLSASLIVNEGASGFLAVNWIPNVLGLLLVGAVIYFPARWALPDEELQLPSLQTRILRTLALLLAGLAFVLGLFLLASLMRSLGIIVAQRIGGAGFLGEFIADLGAILDLLVAGLVGLAVGAVVSSFVGRYGRIFYDSLSKETRFIFNLVMGMLAGAVMLVLIMLTLNWFYVFKDPMVIYVYPAILGALLGAVAAIRTRSIDKLPVGLVVYYATRTALNALRAVEALIMVIIFAVWVGIGPFAGVLALSLHTIAALGKLFSEQVESISAGPLEAIKATGATRLQTIVYAVIPQIVPPYISFTMYRWDINVRMSTIIGFAGGGGIGFLLQQNINQLRYRDAAVQILAIAIVVSLMDYLSSFMRERAV